MIDEELKERLKLLNKNALDSINNFVTHVIGNYIILIYKGIKIKLLNFSIWVYIRNLVNIEKAW